MKHCIRTELRKACQNRMLYAALGIGIVISLINVLETATVVHQLTEKTISYIENTGQWAGFAGCSLFIKWIAVNGTSFGYRAFYFVWPIMAAMPYGWSYYEERKNGVYNQIVSRCGKNAYFTAKFIAVFVSGSLATATPVLLNLLVNATICPAITPMVQSSLVAIFDGNAFSELYYSHPWVHSILWCLIDGCWGGVAACLCFLLGAKPRFQILVTLFPFVLLVMVEWLCDSIVKMVGLTVTFSPMSLAAAAGPYANPEWAVFGVMLTLFVLSVLIGRKQVVGIELV